VCIDPVEGEGAVRESPIEHLPGEFLRITPLFVVPPEPEDPVEIWILRGEGADHPKAVGSGGESAEPDPLPHLSRSDQVAVGIDEAGKNSGIRRNIEYPIVDPERAPVGSHRRCYPAPLYLDGTWFYERYH
jgi:hypothetical protein